MFYDAGHGGTGSVTTAFILKHLTAEKIDARELSHKGDRFI